ncbi:MAG: glycosyltransferase [Chloroflexi bacterium]|nr:MAG: glycosyltransferase [Chloroflexota bacterium]
MIVAMAGGGADAYALMRTLVDAVPEIRATQPCTFVIVTGPFMPELERRDLKQRAEGLPVRLRTMVGDPLKYLAAADLVVAMAGYNTTMEVLRMGTPALLVPRRGPSSEQRMRARRSRPAGHRGDRGALRRAARASRLAPRSRRHRPCGEAASRRRAHRPGRRHHGAGDPIPRRSPRPGRLAWMSTPRSLGRRVTAGSGLSSSAMAATRSARCWAPCSAGIRRRPRAGWCARISSPRGSSPPATT